MQVPFYFDYACPWAYLASSRIEAYFDGLGVDVDYRPVCLADLAEPTGRGGLPPGQRKRRWYLSDLTAWASMIGAEISLHSGDRRPDTRLLLQAALVAQDRGAFPGFHRAAYRARWAEAAAVDDPAVVGTLLRNAGLDDAALDAAGSDALRERLDGDTAAAIERGVFGVPTLFVGERMFFGNDRFELARHFIAKGAN